MYENEFFVVDLASCSSTGEIINSISIALETLNDSGKRIVLKLNESRLNQSQLLSIQSLITSYGCILDTVETINPETASVAENMNILVQKPIEKRIEEKYKDESKEIGFTPFDINVENKREILSIKEVDGERFEADLTSIQQHQDEININSDLRKVGINPSDDFDKIGEQILSKYSNPVNEVENINNGLNNITVNAELNSEIKPESSVALEVKNDSDVEKNSIGVYKKAYDEELTSNEWEEVDFYETPTTDPVILDSKSTTYINQTLRSGQVLESEGNVVIIGDCHPGSEIRAVGDITVWGILSGIAHAGYKGNTNSKVRALKMNAVQIRIANCYSRRPDGTNIPYIIKSTVFTPEEARIVDNEIMLYKINQN